MRPLRALTHLAMLLPVLALTNITSRADLVLVVNAVPGAPSQGNILGYDAASGAPQSSGPVVPAGLGGLGAPSALAVDAAGNLYVADTADSSVREYNSHGAYLGVFVPSGAGGLQDPTSLQFGPNGDLFIASHDSSSILEYNGRTGAFVQTVVGAGAGGLSNPDGLAFQNGNLYVASEGSDQILRYNASTGAFLGIAVDAGMAGLSQPGGLAFGPDGMLYIASRGFGPNTGTVIRYNPNFGLAQTLISSGYGGLGSPADLAFTMSGTLLVASQDDSNSKILSFDAQTGLLLNPNFIPPGSGGLNTPVGLVVISSVPEPTAFVSLVLGLFAIAATRFAIREYGSLTERLFGIVELLNKR